MKDDQIMHMYFDGQPDYLQSVDFDKNAGWEYNPLHVPGIFSKNKDQLSLFRLQSRSEAADEIDDKDLPYELESVDDLSSFYLAFHKCTLTGEREARPKKCRADEDDKEFISTRGTHPELSEYVS